MIQVSEVYVTGKLRPFTITVEKGEIVALIGADGSGKTEALDVLAGTRTPDGGEMTSVGGAYMTQKSSLFEDMTLRASMKFACDLEGLSHARADERIRRSAACAEVEPWLDKPAAALTKAVLRRGALAMALIAQEENLFLDEPTRDLESADALQIRKTIRDLKEDRAILLSTRSLTEAERLADRIFVMDKGQVIAQCRAGHLDECARSLHTQRALLRDSLEAVQAAGAVRAERSRQPGCVEADFDSDDPEAMLRTLFDRGLHVVEFGPAPLDLDGILCALDTDAFGGEDGR